MKFGCILAEIMLDKHDPPFRHDCPDIGTRRVWAQGYSCRGPTLRARSQPKLHRFSWAETFWIENDIGYNILKNDKNSFSHWREFKSLLQEHEFFEVNFQIHPRFSQKNAQQPNVHQRTRRLSNCHEHVEKILAKNIAVWLHYSSKTTDRAIWKIDFEKLVFLK